MAQGVELMVFGMGTVVAFLALLVVATTVMSSLVGRYFPEPHKPSPSRPQPAPGAVQDDAELVAAISAALHQHRREK